MEAVTPKLVVIINGKNITADISPFFNSASYTDRVHGESDEIQLSFDNTAGFWFDDWLPTIGDVMDIRLGYGGKSAEDDLLPCGQFTIDEISFSGPPDMVNVRGLATGIKHPIRTRKSHVFEKQPLASIVGLLAKKNNLTVAGDIGNHLVEKCTQYNESDLSFLSKLLQSWGYVFNVRGSTIYVYDIYKLEGKTTVFEIAKSELTDYNIDQKTTGKVKSTTVKYFDPDKVQLITATKEAEGTQDKADTLEIRNQRVENPGEASARSKAMEHSANSAQTAFSFSTIGNTSLLAGNNISIVGFGTKLSGKFHIMTSTHTVSTSGYVTNCECKKLQ